jgi:hypothetical protein
MNPASDHLYYTSRQLVNEVCAGILNVPLDDFICIIFPFTAFIQIQDKPAGKHPEFFIWGGGNDPNPKTIHIIYV